MDDGEQVVLDHAEQDIAILAVISAPVLTYHGERVIEGNEFLVQIRSFVSGLHELHWPTVALATGVLLGLLAFARLAPRSPFPLIAILVAAVVVSVFSLHRSGIKVVGDVPGGLPVPEISAIPAADLMALLIPAAGIAIVAFNDNVLTARTFAVRLGQEIDANAELRALLDYRRAQVDFERVQEIPSAGTVGITNIQPGNTTAPRANAGGGGGGNFGNN